MSHLPYAQLPRSEVSGSGRSAGGAPRSAGLPAHSVAGPSVSQHLTSLVALVSLGHFHYCYTKIRSRGDEAASNIQDR